MKYPEVDAMEQTPTVNGLCGKVFAGETLSASMEDLRNLEPSNMPDGTITERVNLWFSS